MKAIQMRAPGAPEVLEYVDVPTPSPGPTQVLIKAHAIGVSMPEVMVRKGIYNWMPPMPAVPGIEMSGIVEKVGDKVTRLKAGDAIFASAREFKERGGCYAEYLVAEEHTVYALPQGVDLDLAACLSNYQVAWHLLHTATQGFKYDSVLVLAAAGGVGTALIQLAKNAGKRVIGLAGTDEKVKFALSQGADSVVNYRTGKPTEGVDLVLDPVGGAGTGPLFDLLNPFGMLILYGSLEGPPDPKSVIDGIKKPPIRSLAFRQFTMHTMDHRPELRAPATNELIRLLAEGKIRPPIHERIPLSQASRAHALLEGGKVLGKIIMKP
jgi:NADPH2:quinone reductase